MQDELEIAGERRFDGSAVHFAVPLAGMAVADDKLRSRLKHRKKQGGALGQVLQVQIATINAGRSGIDFAQACGWRHCHYSHERLQGHFDVFAEQRHISLKVELDYFLIGFSQEIGNDTASRSAAIPAVWHPRLDVEYSNFERVAGFSVVDVNRAREDVRAAVLGTRQILRYRNQIRKHHLRRDTIAFEKRHRVIDESVVRKRLNLNSLT